MIQGIDVSHLQGTIDWQAVEAAGNAFAGIKASEGLGFHDGMFAANWQDALAEGIIPMPYHFFHLEQDGALQAQNFLNALKLVNGGNMTLGPGILPAVLDVEPRPGVDVPSPQDISAEVRIWLTTVSAATGVPAMVYCSPGWWDGAVAPAMPLPGCLFWLAEYGVNVPKLPIGVLDYAFHQYDGGGKCPGVSTLVDLDVFNGGADELAALARCQA